MTRFTDIKNILETAVNGEELGAHGNFWRDLTRDQFIAFRYRSQPLLTRKEDGSFDENESNLIKSLEGLAPFGRDTGTSGATFRRMPAGFPPVPADKIEIIRNWIKDGCPDDEPFPVEAETDPMNLKIKDLMRLPVDDHDLNWLQQALQAAIELELATLPPYLCGQWAIKNQASEAARMIRKIALDEMRHFGLVCNMLRATGQQPQIFTGYDAIEYPGPLPGGVRPKCDPSFFPCDPDFKVVLGFNDFQSFAKMCMQIEYPEDPVPRPEVLAFGRETFPSIGEFYDAILDAFQRNDERIPYQTDKQIDNDSPEVVIINSLAKATEAIGIIQKQGEGASRFPFIDAAGRQLAHFYTFGQIFFGKKYVFDRTSQTGDWTGAPVGPLTAADIFPMTPVPHGGYTGEVPPDVVDCDKAFTRMLQQLDTAWANGDSDALGEAIGSMIDLQDKAIALLGKELPRPGGGIYGPQFRKNTA